MAGWLVEGSPEVPLPKKPCPAADGLTDAGGRPTGAEVLWNIMLGLSRLRVVSEGAREAVSD